MGTREIHNCISMQLVAEKTSLDCLDAILCHHQVRKRTDTSTVTSDQCFRISKFPADLTCELTVQRHLMTIRVVETHDRGQSSMEHPRQTQRALLWLKKRHSPRHTQHMTEEEKPFSKKSSPEIVQIVVHPVVHSGHDHLCGTSSFACAIHTARTVLSEEHAKPAFWQGQCLVVMRFGRMQADAGAKI